MEATGQTRDIEEGKEKIRLAIAEGSALNCFKQMIIGQGTDPNVAEGICHGDKWKWLPRTKFIKDIKAPRSGNPLLSLKSLIST